MANLVPVVGLQNGAHYKKIKGKLSTKIERSDVTNVLENNKNYRTTAFSAQFNSPQYVPKYGLKGEARPPKNVIFVMVESLNTANSRYLSGLQNLVPIEYLQVGEYEVNQFQADPLNPDPGRIIMAADERPQWFFLLDPNGRERKFHYDGDVLVDEVREKMNNLAVNWDEYVKYLAWLRQNF